MESTNDELKHNPATDGKPPVISRFIRSVDWKAVCFVIGSMYAFAIIWWLCSSERLVNMIAITTLVLIIFVGIPLGQIFIENWSKNG
ncbi:MAG TPA: hypothetical protein PKL45_15055 [Bacteroidia bacterium]|nr:hypothetical protein [Bacteroidia bacterium]